MAENLETMKQAYEQVCLEKEELENENLEMVSFIKTLYNLECTTSAFDYQSILRSRILKFNHRKTK